MNLKAPALLFSVSIVLICCNNTSDLNSICKNEKLNSVINDFITTINHHKNEETENDIYITGSKKNDSIYEISVYNRRPTIYTEKTAEFLNEYLLHSRLGHFKYKQFDFFVDDKLNELYQLNYKTVAEDNSNLKKEKIPFPLEYPTMWINLNIKNDKISYTMPFAGIDWTEK